MTDILRPFILQNSPYRGRILRLDALVSDIVARHDCPDPVAYILAESVLCATAVDSLFKESGVFTLQIQGSGPLSKIVADIDGHKIVRAMVGTGDDLQTVPADKAMNLTSWTGPQAYMAMTFDSNAAEGRYQGVVPLQAQTLADGVADYFTQSEQLPTRIKMAVQNVGDSWQAGAIFLQKMPGREAKADTDNIYDEDDDSARLGMLLETCGQQELLSGSLSQDDLLIRLFHEEGVEVYPVTTLHSGCRCSRARIKSILDDISPEERNSLAEDGRIRVDCEFCKRQYVFELE